MPNRCPRFKYAYHTSHRKAHYSSLTALQCNFVSDINTALQSQKAVSAQLQSNQTLLFGCARTIDLWSCNTLSSAECHHSQREVIYITQPSCLEECKKNLRINTPDQSIQYQQTRDAGPTLAYCWASVVDGGPTVNQR